MASNLSKSGRRKFWEHHIAQWGSTGLSQVEYCRSNKISIKSFQYWRRKANRSGSVPALVELTPPKSFALPLSSSPQLCLVVDQCYRIEIGKGFDSEDLERVVRVLGRI